MISIMLGGVALSSSVAAAPKRSGKTASPPSPKVKASGGEPTKTSSGVTLQHFLRIGVGDDQHVAVEMHRRLRHAGGAGGEAEQRDVVAAGLHRLEGDGLVERGAVEFGIVVGRAVEADDLFRNRLSLAQATISSISRVSQSASVISALSTILASSPARSIGIVLTTTAPALVAASQQATIAGLLAERISTRLPGFDAVVLDQRVRQPVRPVGELLVGAAAAIADQRRVVAEAALRRSGRSARRRH